MKKKKPSFFKASPIPIKVDAALLEKIDAIAARIGEQRSTVMRMAMRLGIEAFQKVDLSGETMRVLLALRQPDPETAYPPHDPNQRIIVEEKSTVIEHQKKPEPKLGPEESQHVRPAKRQSN